MTHHPNTQALLCAFACLTTFIVGNLLHFNDTYWALMTVFVLLLETNLHPVLKGIQRCLGTISGALLGLVTLPFFINDVIAVCVLLMVMLTVIAYLSFKSRYPYGLIFANITFFITVWAYAFIPETALEFITWRVADVTIGVLISFLFMLLLPLEGQGSMNLTTQHQFIHSVKIALSAFLSFYVCILLDWFGAISGVITAFVITLQSSFSKVQIKAQRRLLGCTMGGLAGLMTLVIASDNLILFSSVLFFVVYLLGYLKLTQKRDSYIYFQAGLAFFLAVITPDTNKSNDIIPALTRLAGIFLGSGVAITVSYLVYPEAHTEKKNISAADTN